MFLVFAFLFWPKERGSGYNEGEERERKRCGIHRIKTRFFADSVQGILRRLMNG